MGRLLRTDASHTASMLMLDIRPVLNPGELAELLPEFPESEVEVPTGLARELSVTCAEEDVCSPQPRPGEDGTGRSMLPRRDTPCAPPLPPPVFQLWSWPRATSSMASARFLLLFLIRSGFPEDEGGCRVPQT